MTNIAAFSKEYCATCAADMVFDGVRCTHCRTPRPPAGTPAPAQPLSRHNAAQAATALARKQAKARAETLHDRSLAETHELTKKQRRVCELLGKGLSRREIAESMHITHQCVTSHITNARSKLRLDVAGIVRRFTPKSEGAPQ